MAGSVFISSVSQIILKKSANKHYDTVLRQYLNLPVISAYVLFLVSTMITVFALKYVPLSISPMLDALGYVFVAILSFFFLKEHFGKRKLIGFLCIIIGIVIAAV
jgi:drug/metabolite transporter (DMT)-like permease